MTERRFHSEYLSLAETLYKVAYYILESEDEAEDAVQELYLKLWESRKSLDGIRQPKAYCIRMLKNLCIDRIRSAVHLAFTENLPESPAPRSQDDDFDARRRLDKVLKAVKALPERQKQVLLMRTVAGQGATTEAIHGAMGSALGTGSGVMTALIFMAVMYLVNRRYFMKRIRKDRTGREDPWTGIMRDTILVITPFILSGFILNLTTTVNQTIFSKIMIGAKGLDEIDITTAYGIFSNKAVVITNIPISIATAVAAAIIPNISSAYARKDREETRRRVIAAVRITNIIATPCALGLIALARPVTMVLFPQWESLGLASALLALLGVTVIFYSIATIMNAALQSIGRMQMPLVSAGIALAVQTLVLLILLFATNMGVFALVLVSILYSLMIFLLDTYFLQRYLKLDMDLYNVYARPLFAATIMGVATYGLYTMFEVFLELVGSRSLYLNNLIAMVPAILAAVLIYFFALIRMGTLSEEDILSLPRGGMLLKIFRKLKWMKG